MGHKAIVILTVVYDPRSERQGTKTSKDFLFPLSRQV